MVLLKKHLLSLLSPAIAGLRFRILKVISNVSKGGIFMTQNQIAYWNLQEAKRANLEKERELRRSNVAKERENVRSNLAKEAETRRANISSERNARDRNVNEYTLGTVRNQETERHNRASEVLDATNTAASVASKPVFPIIGSGSVGKTGFSKQDLNAGMALGSAAKAAGLMSTGITIVPNMRDILRDAERNRPMVEEWGRKEQVEQIGKWARQALFLKTGKLPSQLSNQNSKHNVLGVINTRQLTAASKAN